jgi:anhydro-N-acetylmuramic acid kinase
MVIDAVVRWLTDGKLDYDRDGEMANAGQPHRYLLERFVEDPFITKEPPKAAGRENFGDHYARALFDGARELGLSDEDIVATATALTVEAIARNYERYVIPRAPIEEVIVGGGGASNPALMRMLRERIDPIPVAVDDDYGIPSTAKEAIYMALIGNEAVRGHANNVPSVTGADGPVVMGLIAPVFRA